jgi:hypothetical protein
MAESPDDFNEANLAPVDHQTLVDEYASTTKVAENATVETKMAVSNALAGFAAFLNSAVTSVRKAVP